MERAIAHRVKAHAEQDACEALDPSEDRQRKPEFNAVRQVAFFQGSVESQRPNPYCRAMREKIDNDQGRALYAQRMGLVEPVFGHTQQRGLRRFTLRGKSIVDTQWKLFCIVHNVAKLQVYGKIAA
jgi:hypothetical protein